MVPLDALPNHSRNPCYRIGRQGWPVRGSHAADVLLPSPTSAGEGREIDPRIVAYPLPYHSRRPADHGNRRPHTRTPARDRVDAAPRVTQVPCRIVEALVVPDTAPRHPQQISIPRQRRAICARRSGNGLLGRPRHAVRRHRVPEIEVVPDAPPGHHQDTLVSLAVVKHCGAVVSLRQIRAVESL